MSLSCKSLKYASSTFRPRNVPSPLLNPPAPSRRPTQAVDSLHGGVDSTYAPRPAAQRYSGTECIGIATMHKSNAVPVFNHQAAVDAATMRRN